MPSPLQIRRVLAQWVRRQGTPVEFPPFHLPIPLVSSLTVGELVRSMSGDLYRVTAVGPGALMLENSVDRKVFTNRGEGAYGWAAHAAPHLHWIL